jgi:hypothetical protein
MTLRRHCSPAPSRTEVRRTLAVLRREFQDYDAPGWFDLSVDVSHGLHFGKAKPDGRIAQSGGDCAVDGWDDLGPEAA